MGVTKRTYQARLKRWLTALRSGKYKQAKEALCKVNKKGEKERYCCLGILTEVYNSTLPKDKKLKEKIDGGMVWFGGEQCWLPRQVEKYLGLPVSSQENLAKLNDDGKSFKTIANYIETNQQELFTWGE